MSMSQRFKAEKHSIMGPDGKMDLREFLEKIELVDPRAKVQIVEGSVSTRIDFSDGSTHILLEG